MVKVEDGQMEMVVAEDGLLEQNTHPDMDRNLDVAEAAYRRRNEPPLLPRVCLLQTGGGPGS